MKDVACSEKGSLGAKVLLLLTMGAVAVMLTALFRVTENDLTAAREQVLRENSSSAENAQLTTPKVSRRDFEIRLPVPGQKGKYEWMVKGDRSFSLDATTDRILRFKGEMVEGDDVIRLSSPVVLFDRAKRVLSSRDGVVVGSKVARVEAAEMVMRMNADEAVFSGNVTTEIDTEKAAARQKAKPAPPGENSGEETAPPETEREEGEKKEKQKRSPLVIRARKLLQRWKENMAIFTGNVVAKDDSGTIEADEIKVYYYSDEERKKDPNLNIKTVECIGNVRIVQVEGQKQALCPKATYDAKTNIVLLEYDPKTGKKVVYRDEKQQVQIQSLWMILDRNKNEVTFEGKRDNQVEFLDYNPDRKSFLGIMEPKKDETPRKPGIGPEAEEKPNSSGSE